MNILSDLKKALKTAKIPTETGVFSGAPPCEYLVITPLSDTFELDSDDYPSYETQEARISLFSKGNYLKAKDVIVKLLLKADFTITDRRYIEHEDDTGFHHYVIDVAKLYELED